MIRIDAAWIAVEPLDMRSGVDTALARVVSVFGAARSHHAYFFLAGNPCQRSNNLVGSLCDFSMPLRLILLPIIATLSLLGCSGRPPPIGRDLPRSFGDMPYFNERVTQRFPAGSDERKLLTELHSERFAITETHEPSSRYRLSAIYEVRGVVCREVWTIQWTAEQGKIKEIAGSNRDICL